MFAREGGIVRLPHISVEYREEESFALGKVSLPLIVGLGVHWTWVFLAMFNSPLIFFPGSEAVRTPLFGVSLAVYALTLLCYGIFLEQARRLFSDAAKRMRNRAVACLMVFAGTALMLLVGASPGADAAIVVASGVLTGVGSAVLLVSYGVSFSVCDIATVCICTALSVLVGCMAFVLVLQAEAIAHAAGAVLCLAIPFVEFVCLNRCSRQLVDKLEFTTATLPVKTAPFALHVCLPNLVIGILLGAVRSNALMGARGNLLVGVGGAGALVCVLILVVMLTQRQSNNFMFRTLSPIAALIIAVLGLSGELDGTLATFLLFSVYLILEACAWVMAADISQRFRLSAFTVMGFSRGSLAVGTFIAYLLALPSSPVSESLQEPATLVALALVLLTLGVALLPKNAELRNTLARGTSCPALLLGDDGFEFGPTPNKAADFDAQRSDASQDHVQAHKPAAHAQPHAPHEAQPQPVAQETPAPMPVSEEPPGEPDTRKQGRFKRKCALIADTYLLSRKETEVLFLLAKGNNAAAIQEQLFISAGTTNTHMRHIYRKLNVHSQQELIDLVDSADVEDVDF